MKKVLEGKTDYEKELKQELKIEKRICNYEGCANRATELFYASFCDLHFYFCKKHASIVEANTNVNNQEEKLTVLNQKINRKGKVTISLKINALTTADVISVSCNFSPENILK